MEMHRCRCGPKVPIRLEILLGEEKDTIKRCRQQQERVLVTSTCTWSRRRTRNGDKCREKQS